jgi:uncharacterized protein (DUF1800 family)
MKPYKPQRYFYRDAAHLLRRAGFGGSSDEVEVYRKLGPEAAAEKLLTFSEADGTDASLFDWRAAYNGMNAGGGFPMLAALWFHRMITTSQPLKEKLALFWHGHFATGRDKVDNAFAMAAQLETFRMKGLGQFPDLVLAVSRDPAMLRYLDNDKNAKGKPNENYARELMELFTIGVHAGYTEKDVQESARAFTGWTRTAIDKGNPEQKFVFTAKNHDDGVKTVLGQTGNWDGHDIVRIVTDHPACAKFMTAKLWRFFVNEKPADNTHDELAAFWTQSKGDVRAVLKLIFSSEEFYAAENRFALVKSPVEYVVGAIRATGAKLQIEHVMALNNVTQGMTQQLFYPPNVKGWDGGDDWLADFTMLNRLNFVAALINGNLPAAKKSRDQQIPKVTLDLPVAETANQTLDLIGRALNGETPIGEMRASMQALATGTVNADMAKRLAHFAMISPQFHLA